VAARCLAATIPEAALTVLPGPRHLPLIECPDIIARPIAALARRAPEGGGDECGSETEMRLRKRA